MSEETIERKDTLVCYGDGSCSGNGTENAFGGWGVHGYILRPTDKPKNVNYPAKTSFKFTSKGLVKKGKEIKESMETIGVLDVIGMSKVGDPEYITNNRAELLAMLTVLEKAEEHDSVGKVFFISDSKYVLNGFETMLDKWKTTNWKTSSGTEVKNKDLWSKIYDVKESLKNLNVTIDTQWVKGHEDDIGNVTADLYATIGTINANLSRHDREASPIVLDSFVTVTEFKKELDAFHFLYHYKDVITSSQVIDSNFEELFLASPKDEEDLGKPNLNAAYLLYRGEIPREIASLMELYRTIQRWFESAFKINLDEVKKNKLLGRIADKLGLDRISIHTVRNGRHMRELSDRKTRLVEDMGREYPFLLEVDKTRKAAHRAFATHDRLKDTEWVIDLTPTFLDEKNELIVKYNEKFLDISDMIKMPEHDLVTRARVVIGKDTPPHAVLKQIAPDIKSIRLVIDTESVGALATFFFVVDCVNEEGKEYRLCQTNLVGKYLIRKNI